ncbi:hypothetical protein F5B20DRAFT_555264 [Whalleya microplaca]|nr:hypothetical protein F5B20DRAFT_555264 [Whalleya microplaca]
MLWSSSMLGITLAVIGLSLAKSLVHTCIPRSSTCPWGTKTVTWSGTSQTVRSPIIAVGPPSPHSPSLHRRILPFAFLPPASIKPISNIYLLTFVLRALRWQGERDREFEFESTPYARCTMPRVLRCMYIRI